MVTNFVRQYIKDLIPYSTARDEFSGEANVFLDANESPFPSQVNRYPDPHQRSLKAKISELKSFPADQIFLGNGSDEAIDLLVRVTTCNEGGVTITPPTYGMYKVAARNNNIPIIEAPLRSDFSLDLDAIQRASDMNSSLIFICSPNNPTGARYSRRALEDVLSRFKGIVVVDEAYIDFSTDESAISLISSYDRLVVLQTFSKAWGLAGIRLGMAFAAPALIHAMNKLKLPYNVSELTQRYALEQLQEPQRMLADVKTIIAERSRVQTELEAMPEVRKVFPSSGNFLLVKIDEPRKAFLHLQSKGVIVRDRSKEPLCDGCLRITIGTRDENNTALTALREIIGN